MDNQELRFECLKMADRYYTDCKHETADSILNLAERFYYFVYDNSIHYGKTQEKIEDCKTISPEPNKSGDGIVYGEKTINHG